MSDALSLATMSGPMLTAAFKFLFDRANSFLERRRAERTAASDEVAAASDDEEVRRLKAAVKVLSVYQTKGIQLVPDDVDLVESMSDVHTELERLEGQPIDLGAVARAGIRVEMQHDEVDGTVTGLSVGEVGANVDAGVVVRTRRVTRGGDVTGLRIDGRLG